MEISLVLKEGIYDCRIKITDSKGERFYYDTFDRFNLLKLIPVAYFFFEPSNSDKLYKLTHAYEINRKDVLKFARDFAVLSLSTYPIQMARVKYLTRNKKVKKVLTKFNNLSDVERQRFFEKQEKYMKS